MTEHTYTELRRLELAIDNHGEPFKSEFESLLNKQPAKSHDNYKSVLIYCWDKLHWRPVKLDTQVYIMND